MTFRKMLGIAAATCIGLTMAASGASAQGKIQTGTLTCKGAGGVGMVVGSQKSLNCQYQAAGSKRTERFSATVTRIGLDVGFTGETTVVWAVLASTANLAPGAIAGDYAGASADVAVAVGGGANILVGGSKNGVFLQPLSVQGQTGLNLAVGVSSLTLRKAG